MPERRPNSTAGSLPARWFWPTTPDSKWMHCEERREYIPPAMQLNNQTPLRRIQTTMQIMRACCRNLQDFRLKSAAQDSSVSWLQRATGQVWLCSEVRRRALSSTPHAAWRALVMIRCSIFLRSRKLLRSWAQRRRLDTAIEERRFASFWNATRNLVRDRYRFLDFASVTTR